MATTQKDLQDRFKRIVTDTERLAAALIKGNRKDYARMLKALRAEVGEAYALYANEEGRLTFADMQKYGRLKEMKGRIDNIVSEFSDRADERTDKTLKAAVRDSYQSSLSAISASAGREISGSLSASRIDAILQKPSSGWTLAERQALRVTDLGIRIKGAVVSSFIHEEGYQEMAGRIKAALEKRVGAIERENGDDAHRVSQDAIREAGDTAGKRGVVVTKTWVSAGDDKVRDAHAALDGQTVEGDEDFVVPSGEYRGARAPAPGQFGIPALDANCRCWLVAGTREG